MKKQKTIINAGIDTDGSVRLYVKTIDVEVTPNYVIPRSNFSTGTPDGAYLIGIPCKVISDPYIIKENDSILGEREEKVYDVISTVTGIQYTIPTGWSDEYRTLEEANEHARIVGMYGGRVTDLIGKKYYPRDNSYIKDFQGKWYPLIRQECEIISLPFKEKTYEWPDKDDKEMTFVLVKYNNKVYRVLFEEWALDNPE